MIKLSTFKAPALIMIITLGIALLANAAILGKTLSSDAPADNLVGKEKPDYEDCAWYNLLCHARNGYRWLNFHIEEIYELILRLRDLGDIIWG
ncbi:MAG: hypothetical protein GF417_08785 [Candidatus Latescibacteria bacterium]|nr:hypothetical protein [Candidatus Latescibacterota bacterium]